MQIYIYTNPQCQAAEISQLPERGAGERRLVATLAQQHLGLVQTSNFSCAESNVNELSSLFELICIRFGT